MDIRNLINQIDRIEEAKAHYIQSKLPYGLTDLVPIISKNAK